MRLRGWLTPWRALLLAGALLAAQAAGLAHKVAHGGSAPVLQSPALNHGHHDHRGDPGHGGHGAHGAHAGHFGHDAGGAECHLYDQLLGHADLLLAAAAASALPAPLAVALPPDVSARSRSAVCAYQARAPPRG